MILGCLKTGGPGFLRWRTALLTLGATLWCAAQAGALTESVTLAWDPSPDPQVIGYYVYYGTESRSYSDRVDSRGSTQATVTGLVPGRTYYFTVTAYNAQRIESAPAGEIVYAVPNPIIAPPQLVREDGSGPPSLQFQVTPRYAYDIQASEDLKSWRTIHRAVSLSSDWISFSDPQAAHLPKRFYRLALPDTPQAPGWMRLHPAAVPHGAVCLRPVVTSGQRYRIEASEDLLAWTPLHEGVCVGARPMDFVDHRASAHPRRFYRLALLDGSQASGTLEILPGGALRGSRLEVAALEGQRYRVQASPDMNSWQTIFEAAALSTDPVQLVDPEAALRPQRFYRLVFD